MRDRVLTAAEIQRMLDVAPESLKPVWQCAYHTGLRQGEIWLAAQRRMDTSRGSDLQLRM
ncbi:MAG: hypothetical protein HYZ81_25785 [Nitrospinae bacterium]|nr:hypothetical protein [Nitrospinota bacterium]